MSSQKALDVSKGIPPGKFRVVSCDRFSNEEYVRGDYDTQAEAFKIADDNNKERTNDMCTAYYVFDGQDNCIRGPEALLKLA